MTSESFNSIKQEADDYFICLLFDIVYVVLTYGHFFVYAAAFFRCIYTAVFPAICMAYSSISDEFEVVIVFLVSAFTKVTAILSASEPLKTLYIPPYV